MMPIYLLLMDILEAKDLLELGLKITQPTLLLLRSKVRVM
jgi:hypothetical protein